jgi:hypothetical protein
LQEAKKWERSTSEIGKLNDWFRTIWCERDSYAIRFVCHFQNNWMLHPQGSLQHEQWWQVKPHLFHVPANSITALLRLQRLRLICLFCHFHHFQRMRLCFLFNCFLFNSRKQRCDELADVGIRVWQWLAGWKTSMLGSTSRDAN